MNLLQSLQDVCINTFCLKDDDSDLEESEPLTKVSSLTVHQYQGESLFYLNLPKLTKLEISVKSDLIPKIERIPFFFENSPLLQEVVFNILYDSHLQMILDTCPMLKKIKIFQLEKDPDFVVTVEVNLDKYLQLESIEICNYPKEINIFSMKDINAKLKKV